MRESNIVEYTKVYKEGVMKLTSLSDLRKEEQQRIIFIKEDCSRFLRV